MPDRIRRRLWPEKAQGAVSLSYDGGDPSHLETVAPCLEALCLQATFYAPPTRILETPRQWTALAAAGHEIGNATLFDAADPDGFLSDWTAEMVERDVEMGEDFYREVFGRSGDHSCACPVPRRESTAGDDRLSIRRMQQHSMLRPILRSRFQVARDSTEGYNDPASCDVLALRCVRAADFVADEFVLLTQQALAAKAWVIFAFDGVGVGEPAVDAVEHAKFCLWLAEHRGVAFVGTVYDVGCRVRKNAAAVAQQGEPQKLPVEARPTA